MAKIDTVRDLPTWFDLKNYKVTAEFSAKDWLFHLHLRATITSMAHMLKFEHSLLIPKLQELREAGSTEAMYVLDLIDVTEAIRNSPTELSLPGNFYWDAAGCITSQETLPANQSIKPLTLHCLLQQKNSDQIAVEDGEADESSLALWKNLEKTETPEFEEIEIQSNASLTEILSKEDHHDIFAHIPNIEIIFPKKIGQQWHNPALTVDLNAPDAAILTAFKEWLKSQRANPPTGAKVSRKPAFDWWSDYGLLPFLDLSVWSLETDNHIPDRVMANAISGDTFGEDRLRKTVKPLASDLTALIDGLKPFATEDFD